MGILKKIFGRNNFSENEKGLSEHLDYLESLREPALKIEKSDDTKTSKIGGLPLSKDPLPWPFWQEKPLSFLCQIDLSELPVSDSIRDFPSSGILYFFYSSEQETWGFDPKDQGSWRVLYRESSDSLKGASPPESLDASFVYEEIFITFTETFIFPHEDDALLNKLVFNDRQFDEYIDLCESVFGDEPCHQVAGHPAAIQDNDMDLECQLVSHGLNCGDPDGYNDPRAKTLTSGRRDWRLLLQLDSDDETDMMWGDMGRLYFWIRDEDLKKKNFDDTWMILQCF